MADVSSSPASGRPPKRPAESAEAQKHRKSAKFTSDRQVTLMALARDPDYYFKDGNIIFRVEQTIFKVIVCPRSCSLQFVLSTVLPKVHRFLLSHDSSAFHDMLSLPSGEQHVEGYDEKPITLKGDTAQEFRNPMWALYALCVFPWYLSVMLQSSPLLHIGHLMSERPSIVTRNSSV